MLDDNDSLHHLPTTSDEVDSHRGSHVDRKANLSTSHQADPESFHEHRIIADRLARKLSARQVQMIAIGGTIGTGLFLGTGKSLATGGPGSMLIAYLIVGVIVFLTMLALGEMAAFMPIAGVSLLWWPAYSNTD